ncbi:iron compound ABC transporter permease [Planococcus antarcticus DSM 14505]|uniref:Iron compound ABC transporter permease n=1 Tax=Planococcus antarcticus DSM 14505 TaxID=1185653 RepID=A0AA87LUG8_9BACL|nr:iron ABC transporter permease [Planococcus antarcticus]EIM06240.1 iron compound ABC transporter permease [Planococcus antarcticus DSM 14505]
MSPKIPFPIKFILSLLLLVLTLIVSLIFGAADISLKEVGLALFSTSSSDGIGVIREIRLPREIAAIFVGSALAVSGAMMQGITRNDLADPGIIGINSGAGVAIAVFFLFIPVEVGAFAYLLPVVAFGGALLTAVLIYVFSYSRSTGLQPIRLVLVGIGFSMALSGVMIVLISSAEPEKVDFIANWLAGSVWGADWPFIVAIVPWLLVLIPFTLYKANRMNVLGLSDPVAVGIGVSIEKERLVLLLAAVALAASAVSVTGGIAFIGLMAPHIAKAIVGPRHQLFLPLAILIGGWLLLLADTVGRNLLEPSGIPAGIMAALIGAPYFIYLLLKK